MLFTKGEKKAIKFSGMRTSEEIVDWMKTQMESRP